MPDPANPLRVLVVDDEPDIRTLLVTAFETRGHTVVPAADGHQAVALWTRTEPDLIVLDVLMPGIDGIEATRRIRAAERCGAVARRTPVVLVSALAFSDEVESGLEAGADAYLSKPFSLGELIETGERIAADSTA